MAALNWQVQNLQQWNTANPDGAFSTGLPVGAPDESLTCVSQGGRKMTI
jgi:hypothetical protein